MTFAAQLFGASYGYVPSTNRCAIRSADNGYVTFYKLAYSIVPFTIICFSYLSLVLFVKVAHLQFHRRNAAALRDHAVGKTVPPARELHRQIAVERRERRMTVIAFSTCVVFMVGYMPNALLGLLGKLAGVHSSAGVAVMLWMQLGKDP